jgi:hypothetical protein
MFYSVNKITDGDCLSVGIAVSKEKAISFVRKYIDDFIKRWDGAAHLKSCVVDLKEFGKEEKYIKDKHYVFLGCEVSVKKYETKYTEGFLGTYESNEMRDVFKMKISEVHGNPDRSRNIDFNAYEDESLAKPCYDDVMIELISTFNQSSDKRS